MFYNKKCFWWCSVGFIILLVIFVGTIKNPAYPAPIEFNIMIGKGDNSKMAGGFYDEKRGVLVINTRGGIELGPLIPAKDKTQKKIDARLLLRDSGK